MSDSQFQVDLIVKGSIEKQLKAYRKAFRKREKREPSAEELQLEIFDAERAYYDEHWQMGLARNALLHRARYLHRLKRYRDAILYYLAVSVYDANGPRNLGVYERRGKIVGLIDDRPPFDVNDSLYMGVNATITHYIGICCRKGKMTEEDVEQIYKEGAVEHFDEHMPLGPDQVWSMLQEKLEI
ncbi:hypothetical protein [Henriciella aquimarina]|uniref:hypothetical protein n=1 Tax=Henriciella aquimarina TaxID=545261 RepID=UPI000A062E67|nr:hypothetical protein [Henriciella aquimarina]